MQSTLTEFVQLLGSRLVSVCAKYAPWVVYDKYEGPLCGGFQRGTLWEQNEEITFSFKSHSGTKNQREKTQVLMEELFMYTNLTIVWVDDDRGVVRISFNDYLGSVSEVGTRCRKVRDIQVATTNLQDIAPYTQDPNDAEAHTILHECGHISGLIHEHQVPERPQYFNFIEEEVQEEYRLKMTTQEIHRNITMVLHPQDLENCSRYDCLSVMGYPIPPSLTFEGKGTRLISRLSDVDKAVLTLNYARRKPHPKAPDWTISHAADVLGITGELREKIVPAEDARDIRRYYTKWSKEQMETPRS